MENSEITTGLQELKTTLSALVEYNIDLSRRLENKYNELDTRIKNLEKRFGIEWKTVDNGKLKIENLG